DYIASCVSKGDGDAADNVARNEVASAGLGSTDLVVGRAQEDDYPTEVTEGHGAGDVRADVVAFDHVGDGGQAVDANSLPGVARDNVPRPGAGSANGVARRLDFDTALAIAQSLGAGCINTDEVSLHQVVVGARSNVEAGIPSGA